jgi:hypothetical protein
MVVTRALSDPVYDLAHHLLIGRKGSAMLKDDQNQRAAIKAVTFADMGKWGVLQSSRTSTQSLALTGPV